MSSEMKRLLSAACSSDSTGTLLRLLAAGGNPNTRNRSGKSLVYIASERGFDKCIQILFNWGARAKLRDYQGNTPLHAAARFGHINSVRILLQNSGCVDCTNIDGSTALLIAIEHGHKDIVSYLIEHGANVSLADDNKETAFMKACQMQHFSMAEMLLTLGADMNARDRYGRTAMIQACCFGNVPSLWFLLRKQADGNVIDHMGLSALSHASLLKSPTCLKLLLSTHSIDINACDNNAWTPLHHAVMAGRLNCCTALLEHGADVTIKSFLGLTPMHLASRQGGSLILIVLKLIEYGADVTAVTTANQTPLHIACSPPVPRERMLSHQSSVSLEEAERAARAFHFSTRESSILFTAQLILQSLAAGSTFRYVDFTAVVQHDNNNKVVVRIKSDGAMRPPPKCQPLLNAQDTLGNTPLHMACMGARLDIIILLLIFGADISVMNNIGNSPLDCAPRTDVCKAIFSFLRWRDKFGAMVALHQRGARPSMPLIFRIDLLRCVIFSFF